MGKKTRLTRLLRGVGNAETAARNPSLPVEVVQRMAEWVSVSDGADG